jgi:hypothetical protein
MIVRSIWMSGLLALAIVVVACGGGDDKDYSGEAAQAVAVFFNQEAAAGALPEGTTVRARGSSEVVKLEREDATARVCVTFEYIRAMSPFDRHYRVYIATLNGGQWAVESVNPDGSCEGVV